MIGHWSIVREIKKVNKIRKILTVLFIAAGLTGWSQNVEVYAKMDSSNIMIGDQVDLELGINVPESFYVSLPFFKDTITTNIEIIKKDPIDTIQSVEGVIISQKYTITSFDSGYFRLPDFEFMYHHESDTAVFRTNANTLYLMVNTPVVDTSQAFKVIKGPVSEPYTFMEIFPWVLAGLFVIGAIIFIIWYLRKQKRNQPLFVRKPKPALPPDVLAIQKLEELRLSKTWQQGKLKSYYTQLTDIAREYFEGRFYFDAMEMTSDEIMAVLKEKPVNKEIYEKMGNVLQLADLVKFAKATPMPLENDQCLNHCIDFVKETKPVPVVDQVMNKVDEPEIKREG
jgi:hypothetical protein